MKIRINKYLSQNGICSRREGDRLIEKGLVKINNKIAILGDRVDPAKDKIECSEKEIKLSDKNKIYYIINKPIGYTSTVFDPYAKKVVTSLVSQEPRVFPVGRLDKNSQGLMILTNDGELTNQLTHPSFEHEKEYEVECVIRKGTKTQESAIHRLEKFKTAMRIDNENMKASNVSNIEFIPPELVKFNITLKEGKKRQVRRMCNAVGLEVIKLKRIRIGKLKLANLAVGKFKKIKRSDII